MDSAEARRLYPVNVEETTTGGRAHRHHHAAHRIRGNRKRVLINLHGGGFNSDSGSLIEGDPDREPGKDQSRLGLLPTRAGKSFPCRSGRCGRGLQRAAENLFAAQHWNFRNLGRSDSDGRGNGPAQATRIALACGARYFFWPRRLQPPRRLPAIVYAKWISRARCNQPILIICRTINMSARPIAKIQFCRRFSPICMACRPALLVTSTRDHAVERHDDISSRAAGCRR